MANSRKKRKLSPRGWYTVGEWLDIMKWAPHMTYDAPRVDAATKVAKMQEQLAPHNLTVKYTPKGKYIFVEPLDWDGRIALHWLTIADTVVFDNDGGCEG